MTNDEVNRITAAAFDLWEMFRLNARLASIDVFSCRTELNGWDLDGLPVKITVPSKSNRGCSERNGEPIFAEPLHACYHLQDMTIRTNLACARNTEGCNCVRILVQFSS